MSRRTSTQPDSFLKKMRVLLLRVIFFKNHSRRVYSDVQKSVPVKLARLLLDITIGCCFDSHPRIDSVLQKSRFRYGLLQNAINLKTAVEVDENGTNTQSQSDFG
jgi:hypothetical protein